MCRLFILTFLYILCLAGCNAHNSSNLTEIRAGDDMEAVLATLAKWNATEYAFDRYMVAVPFDSEPSEQTVQRRTWGVEMVD